MVALVGEFPTAEALAVELDCSPWTVHRWLQRHQIPSPGIHQVDSRLNDPDWLRRRYIDDGLSIRRLGDEIGVSRETVRRHLKRHGIERG